MKKEIWGFYPPPIGGISIYCKRLVEKLYLNDKDVLLRNFAKSKSSKNYVVDVKHRIWAFISLIFVKKRIIHSQFTNINMLLLLYLFGWRHPLIITLHNRRIVLLDGWKRKVVNRLFRRARYLIYNDDSYTEELQKKYDIDTGKIIILPTYISPSKEEIRGVTNDIEEFCSNHACSLSANANRLMKNVFGDVYGLNQIIELMDRLVNRDGVDAGFVFCIAEVYNNEYYDECLARIEELNLKEHFLFVIESSVNGFEVWARTDIFLRPTMSDMEGISVKEALEFGTPVVASDVCVRPAEAVLYKKGDIDDLHEKVVRLLQTKSRVEYKPDVVVPEEVEKLYSNFCK